MQDIFSATPKTDEEMLVSYGNEFRCLLGNLDAIAIEKQKNTSVAKKGQGDSIFENKTTFWTQPDLPFKGDKLEVDKIHHSADRTDDPLSALAKSEGGGGLSALAPTPSMVKGSGKG